MRRLAGLTLAAWILASAPGLAQPVVVASKIDTEGALLGNLIAVALTQSGIPVTRRIQLGPTEIVRKAIMAGQIDVYPEYTGNGRTFFRRETDPVWRDAERGYETVRALDLQQNRLVWLAPAPADNTWAIAVRGDLASAEKLSTLGDFAHYVLAGGAVKLAGSAEFVSSPGALPAFQAAYGFKLRRSQLLVLAAGDTAATIRAAAEGTSGVNSAMAYGTDGALAVLGLVALADDKKVQVVYRPAPVIRALVLERYPDIRRLLELVFARLSLETLRKLNARIAVEGFDAKSVAADFLAAAPVTAK
ncbi:MAG TPA: ABC transporter substrate-binding protein [Alphaproteobacteria bacterium]